MSWRLLIPFFSVLLCCNDLNAAEIKRSEDLNSNPKRGWWWYEILPSEEENVDNQERILPSLSDYSLEKLWEMHPDEFQSLLLKIHKKAVMTLKENDVRDYLVIQDIARRKALAFTNVNAMIVQKYPGLSLEADFPTVLPGRNAKVRQERMEIETELERSRKDFALIYFYSPVCHFCTEQSRILNFFLTKYPWEVRKVDITKQPELAENLGVRGVPYLLLISKKNQETIPISAGVISLKTLEKRLFRGIRLINKETTPEGYSMFEYERGGGFDATAPLKVNGVPHPKR